MAGGVTEAIGFSLDESSGGRSVTVTELHEGVQLECKSVTEGMDCNV